MLLDYKINTRIHSHPKLISLQPKNLRTIMKFDSTILLLASASAVGKLLVSFDRICYSHFRYSVILLTSFIQLETLYVTLHILAAFSENAHQGRHLGIVHGVTIPMSTRRTKLFKT